MKLLHSQAGHHTINKYTLHSFSKFMLIIIFLAYFRLEFSDVSSFQHNKTITQRWKESLIARPLWGLNPMHIPQHSKRFHAYLDKCDTFKDLIIAWKDGQPWA